MGISVGIDLGTSNSCVAWVGPDGPVVLPDSEGKMTQPSVVAFGHGGNVVVGRRARRNMVYAPKTTIASAKRLIGRRHNSDVVQRFIQNTGYDVVAGPKGDARIQVGTRVFAVPEISAHVLRHMKEIAEQATGQQVDGAVITVPAYFNDHQRQATRDAATIAGLDCLRIINEPTAAALAYGFNRGRRQHIAVYDLGGGTFDISILRLDDDIFEVVSTSGDTFLGGDDFDYAVGDWLMEQFRLETGIDLTEDRNARFKLRAAGERAKIGLTRNEAVRIEVPDLARDAEGKMRGVATRFDRVQYARIVLPLIQKTFLTCDDALSQARMAPGQIDHVLMVGGMTRSPVVRESVGEYFSKTPYTEINPDQVVAIGAAIQAHNLTTDDVDSPGSVLLDVTPQSLGIRTVGGFCEVLIPRNTPIPTDSGKTFSTAVDGQVEVRVEVYQGESRMADDNELLGQFVLDGLRKAPRGDVKVRITFEIDADGIVQVMAEDLERGEFRDLRIEASSGMSEEEVQSLSFEELDF
ncbi:MAG: Hsp70 family protein [Alphaproteobacteria bacterium]|nr:Hsp70 family protein [Alphaproteobacteria bacterium]